MNKIRSVLLSLAIILSMTSCTPDNKASIVSENLRVILPPPVARTTSIYGVIKNTGDTSDTLLSITSNAGSAMLHKTDTSSGQAQMNHINQHIISAGQSLELKPMSYHIMLMGINHDLIKEDSTIELGLYFKNAGKILFNIPISRS